MLRTIAICLLLILVITVGCAEKDPYGYLTQAEGALQYHQIAQAFVHAAKHSQSTLDETVSSAIKSYGNGRACPELSKAVRMAYEESVAYDKAGKMTDLKVIKDAHRRLLEAKNNFCND